MIDKLVQIDEGWLRFSQVLAHVSRWQLKNIILGPFIPIQLVHHVDGHHWLNVPPKHLHVEVEAAVVAIRLGGKALKKCSFRRRLHQ